MASEGPIFAKSHRKEGFNNSPEKDACIFPGKSDDSQMRETRKFHLLGPCQQEGPTWEKTILNSPETCLFLPKYVTVMSTSGSPISLEVGRPLTFQNVHTPSPPLPSLPKLLKPKFLGEKTKMMVIMTV